MEGVAGQQFNEGITAVAFGESGESLLELREGRFSGSDGAAARQAVQRQRESGGSGDGQNQDECEAGGSDAAIGKRARIGDDDQQ